MPAPGIDQKEQGSANFRANRPTGAPPPPPRHPTQPAPWSVADRSAGTGCPASPHHPIPAALATRVAGVPTWGRNRRDWAAPQRRLGHSSQSWRGYGRPALAYAQQVARSLFRRALRTSPRLALAGLALVFLGGCRADLTVAVRATAEGDGDVSATVSLDQEAMEQVQDLAGQLRLDDLKEAGWSVAGPAPAPGGRTEVRAEKDFASPAEATRLLQELSGPRGPFGSLSLTRDRSLLETRTSLTGTVDLAGGLAAFSDDVLEEKLGGLPLGVDLAQLEAELGKPLAEVFGFRLTTDLPGEVEGPTEWTVRLGDTTPVKAVAEKWNLTAIAAGITSLAAGLALVAVLARRTRRRS